MPGELGLQPAVALLSPGATLQVSLDSLQQVAPALPLELVHQPLLMMIEFDSRLPKAAGEEQQFGCFLTLLLCFGHGPAYSTAWWKGVEQQFGCFLALLPLGIRAHARIRLCREPNLLEACSAAFDHALHVHERALGAGA